LLTILGFCCTTRGVFDKVKETAGACSGGPGGLRPRPPTWRSTRRLMRSINTSRSCASPVLGCSSSASACSGVPRRWSLCVRWSHPAGAAVVFWPRPVVAEWPNAPQGRGQPGGGGAGPRRPDHRDADGDSTGELDLTDDDALASEQRRERAVAAASGCPRGPPAAAGRPAAGPPGRPWAAVQVGAAHRQAPPVTALSRAFSLIREVPGLPRSGGAVRDITPLLADAAAFAAVIEALAEPVAGADRVVGVEARGFLLGAAVPWPPGSAWSRCARPASCPGRRHPLLPAGIRLRTLELPAGGVHPGARAYLVDDVLATGGTLLAKLASWSSRSAAW